MDTPPPVVPAKGNSGNDSSSSGGKPDKADKADKGSGDAAKNVVTSLTPAAKALLGQLV